MTHWRLASEKCSSRPMDGRATCTMAMSRTTMNWAAAMATRANHRRGSVPAMGSRACPSGETAVSSYSMGSTSSRWVGRPPRVPRARGPWAAPDGHTLTVECTTGTANRLACFTVETMFRANALPMLPTPMMAGAQLDSDRAQGCTYDVTEIEPDRLHHLKRRALGEHVRCGEHARVLLDHGCRCGGSDLVQVAPDRCPGVLAILHEERCRIDARDRLPRALGDVRHVLLMQRHIVARAEPAHMSADEVLPRVSKRVCRRLDVAGDVLCEVGEIDRGPARIDDVDQHQRVVIGQVDGDVVRRVVGAVPCEIDPLPADLERARVLEGLLVRRPRRVVVPKQEPTGLLVTDARDALVEQ